MYKDQNKESSNIGPSEKNRFTVKLWWTGTGRHFKFDMASVYEYG
jgi:hypothetical protein